MDKAILKEVLEETLPEHIADAVKTETAEMSKKMSDMETQMAEFAVAAINRGWTKLGKSRYPKAKRLLITADSGGSNSPRTRLWRVELQKFANKSGLIIELCHYPPGTSKWNKIEHKLFCHITRWRSACKSDPLRRGNRTHLGNDMTTGSCVVFKHSALRVAAV